MSVGLKGHAARAAVWWIRRNPTYLLSATAMAVGAKLYLCSPHARAGDAGLILLTLATLQLYELAVSVILGRLHQLGRSPEDWPALMLVAAVFWTGPLVATLELAEHDGRLGTGFALAAGALALAEFGVLRRALALRMSVPGQLAAALMIGLLAAAPSFLRVPHGSAGTNEAALYLCWWGLAAAGLLLVPALRWHAGRPAAERPVSFGWNARSELLFLVITIGAAAAHLVAMNYVFCGHARFFYVGPLIAAGAAVGFAWLAALRVRNQGLRVASAAVPALAIILALQPFDRAVAAATWPAALRDPVVCVALFAAAVWWYGFHRHRWGVLLHAGSAGAGLAIWRLAAGSPDPRWPLHLPLLALYALAAYLLITAIWRRSRVELGAAILAHTLATGLVLHGRGSVADFLTVVLVGWSTLVLVHAIARRPPWLLRALPVACLVLVTCAYENDAELRGPARLHGAALAAALIAVGTFWPWTRYRLLGTMAGFSWVLFCVGNKVARGPNALAAVVTGAAFVLLFGAAGISWHKRRLLQMTAAPQQDLPPTRPTTNAGA